MSDITFSCIHCGRNLVVDARGAGYSVPCPMCKKAILIPITQSTLPIVEPPPPASEPVKPRQATGGKSRWVRLGMVVAAALVALSTVVLFWIQVFSGPRVKQASTWRPSAEQGQAEAQFKLALCYSQGEGVAVDQAEAVRWLRKAAEQGYAEAQQALGVCYNKGEGVGGDQPEACKWFRKAAEQGNPLGQSSLAVC